MPFQAQIRPKNGEQGPYVALEKIIDRFTGSTLKHFRDIANEIELTFMKWYQTLEDTYTTPGNCQLTLINEFQAKWQANFNKQSMLIAEGYICADHS